MNQRANTDNPVIQVIRKRLAAAAGHRLKTIVINEKENTRVPFLRGILIRSLLDTGLEFEEAFEIGQPGAR